MDEGKICPSMAAAEGTVMMTARGRGAWQEGCRGRQRTRQSHSIPFHTSHPFSYQPPASTRVASTRHPSLPADSCIRLIQADDLKVNQGRHKFEVAAAGPAGWGRGECRRVRGWGAGATVEGRMERLVTGAKMGRRHSSGKDVGKGTMGVRVWDRVKEGQCMGQDNSL